MYLDVEASLICLVRHEEDPAEAIMAYPSTALAQARALALEFDSVSGVTWAVHGGYRSLTDNRARMWVLRMFESRMDELWVKLESPVLESLRSLLFSVETSALDSGVLRELGLSQGAFAALSYPAHWPDVFAQIVFSDAYPISLRDHFFNGFCRELGLVSPLRLDWVRTARFAFKQTDPNGRTVAFGTVQHLAAEHLLGRIADTNEIWPVDALAEFAKWSDLGFWLNGEVFGLIEAGLGSADRRPSFLHLLNWLVLRGAIDAGALNLRKAIPRFLSETMLPTGGETEISETLWHRATELIATCGTIEAGCGNELGVAEWIQVVGDLIFQAAPDDDSTLNIVGFLSHLSLARPDLTTAIWGVILHHIELKLPSCRLDTGDNYVATICRIFCSASVSSPDAFIRFLEEHMAHCLRESSLVGAVLAILYYTRQTNGLTDLFYPFMEMFGFLLEPPDERSEVGYILFYFYSIVNEMIQCGDCTIRDFVLHSFGSLIALVVMVNADDIWCHTFAEICHKFTQQSNFLSWLSRQFVHEMITTLLQCPHIEVFEVIGHLFPVLSGEVQSQLLPVLRDNDPSLFFAFLAKTTPDIACIHLPDISAAVSNVDSDSILAVLIHALLLVFDSDPGNPVFLEAIHHPLATSGLAAIAVLEVATETVHKCMELTWQLALIGTFSSILVQSASHPMIRAYFSLCSTIARHRVDQLTPDIAATITSTASAVLDHTYNIPCVSFYAISILEPLASIYPEQMIAMPIIWASISFVLASDFDPGDCYFANVVTAAMGYHKVLLGLDRNAYEKTLKSVIGQFADIIWADHYISALCAVSDRVPVSIKQLYVELHILARVSQWA
jgi:hypothetical protein